MKKSAIIILIGSLLGGCSLITPERVAFTAGKEVVKKVIKHVDESDDNSSQDVAE